MHHTPAKELPFTNLELIKKTKYGAEMPFWTHVKYGVDSKIDAEGTTSNDVFYWTAEM